MFIWIQEEKRNRGSVFPNGETTFLRNWIQLKWTSNKSVSSTFINSSLILQLWSDILILYHFCLFNVAYVSLGGFYKIRHCQGNWGTVVFLCVSRSMDPNDWIGEGVGRLWGYSQKAHQYRQVVTFLLHWFSQHQLRLSCECREQ